LLKLSKQLTPELAQWIVPCRPTLSGSHPAACRFLGVETRDELSPREIPSHRA